METKTLLYFDSNYIIDYLKQHPITEKTWKKETKMLAKRGGIGDQAGPTPTPAVYEFLRLLYTKKDLFTQQEYYQHCWETWAFWIKTKPKKQKWGVAAKLYRNFYPAMIDALYVWALLAETKLFSICYLDAIDDAVGKSDLTVVSHSSQKYHLQLSVGTHQARKDAQYKQQYRNTDNTISTIRVELPMARERTNDNGNKRWYCIEDFQFLLEQEQQRQITSLTQQDSQEPRVKEYFDHQFQFLQQQIQPLNQEMQELRMLVLQLIPEGKQLSFLPPSNEG